MSESLAEMFRYNAWANRELFAACRALTDEQLEARIPGTMGSVRELLLHIVGGQQTLVLRTQGRQHEGELTPQSSWPGIDRLTELIASTSDELISIAEALDDEEQVVLAYRGRHYRFPKRFFLVHAMEHSAGHRVEVKVTLAQIGVETPDLDSWNYAAAVGYGQEVAPSR